MKNTDAARKAAADLIADLRRIAGRSGTVEFLERLKTVDVYGLESIVEYPQPMAFADAWTELLEALLEEARR